MYDTGDDAFYRAQFLKDRYDERSQSPWGGLEVDAEQTSTVIRDVVAKVVADRDRIGATELTTFYRLCHHDEALSADDKRKRVQDLNLPTDATEEITEQIDDSIGSVGKAQTELDVVVGGRDEDNPEATQLLHDCFERLVQADASESELVDAVDDLIEVEFYQIQSGRMSPILYYLAPTVFPIINNRTVEGMQQYFGCNVSQSLSDYLDERKKYLEVREEFGFREHFRDLDWFFVWTRDDENPWTAIDKSEATRNYWQAQPGTTSNSWPEVLWPQWQDEDIISVGFDYGPVSELSTDELGDQGKILFEKMTPGDIVVSKRGNSDFLGFGVVTPGGYEYRTEPDGRITFENRGASDEHPAIRNVEWILTVDTESAIDTSDWSLRRQFHDKTVQGYKCYNELRYKLLQHSDQISLSDLEELERKSSEYLGEEEQEPRDIPPITDERTVKDTPTDRRLVTIRVSQGGLSEHFKQSVQSDVDARTVTAITGQRFDRDSIRVWGNQSTTIGEDTVESGDWLLFFEESAGYVVLAEVLGTDQLDSGAANTFCDKIWPHFDSDNPFNYIIYLSKVAEADVDIDRFFGESVLGFDGHPYDGWTDLDNHMTAIAAEYRSVEDFLKTATGAIEYDYWDPQEWVFDQSTRTAVEQQLNRKGQLIFYGPPGTGKTHTAQKFARWWIGCQTRSLPDGSDRIKSVTFHPSFSYEDFIEGYTVGTGDESESETGDRENSEGQFKLQKGRFRTFCENAEEAYDTWQSKGLEGKPPRYVFLIDEANRGNVAQIFGETITLLEQDKRGTEVELAHSGDSFTIPPNVFVLATMNTADQSIALVDAALRRRFASFPMMPDYDVIYEDDAYPFDDDDEALELLKTGRKDTAALKAASVLGLKIINHQLLEEGGISKGKRIGHSYLLSSEWEESGLEDQSLRDVWRFDILTLLEEYFYGDLTSLTRNIFDMDPDTCAFFDPTTHDIAQFSVSELRDELETFVIENQDRITTSER